MNLGVTPKSLDLDKVIEGKSTPDVIDIKTKLNFPSAETPYLTDDLTALHTAVSSYLDGDYVTNAAAYLKDVLVGKDVDDDMIIEEPVVNVNTINGVKYPTSNLTVVDNGVNMQASYHYNEFSATPDLLSYVYEVTTWYGQQFTITKNIAIKKDINTYDFFHTISWVKELTSGYMSEVTHEYFYTTPSKRNASEFWLGGIKLREAFDVKKATYNADGELASLSKPMSDDELEALGVSVQYTTKNPIYMSMILDNVFEYKTKDSKVYISGHLYLETGVKDANGNPEVIKLPTNFDGMYKDYYIENKSPLADHIAENLIVDGVDKTKIVLNDAGKYHVNVWSLLSLKDKRGFELFGWTDVNKTEFGWVKGDDDNGFARGFSPSDTKLYGASINFEISNWNELPDELQEATGKVNVTPSTGILTFDYTNKFKLQRAADVKVKVTVVHTYGSDVKLTGEGYITFTVQTIE